MDKTQMQPYRQKLFDMRHRITEEVNQITQRLPEEIRSTAELSNVPTHNADRDVESLFSDLELERNENQLLDQIEQALAAIEDGSYGTCRDCGAPIATERLDALPFAMYCVPCEEAREEQGLA